MEQRTMRHAASAAGEYKCLLLDCVEACSGSHSAELLREAVLVSWLGTMLLHVLSLYRQDMYTLLSLLQAG